jgi:hypothetical protein
MCDPISAAALAGSVAAAGGGVASAAASALPLLSLVGSVGAAGLNYMGQQQTQEAEQNANDQWVAYQKQAAATAQAKDAANRAKATAAEQTTLNAVSPQSQEANQQAAAGNLNTAMLAGGPAAPDANVAVLGGGDPSNTAVTNDMAQRITGAARAAQGRIAALAGMTSYGGGYGDMGQLASSAISTGNEGISLASDFRKGDTATLGVAQQVQPLAFTQGSNIAGTLASQLANIAGSAYGSKLKAAAAPATS